MAIILQQGDAAPAFSGQTHAGAIVNLSDFKGKTVVLFFYPQNDTPACTANACSLRDAWAELTARHVVVIGVSPDTAASHKNFAAKYNFNFLLIPDVEKQILTAYGAWGEKNMYGKIVTGVLRSTFIINGEGIIQHVIKKVDTKAAAAQVMKHL